MRDHVICFGNLLAGDDGFGIHVYDALQRSRLPADVEVFDAGISGMGALAHFEHCERAIVVDALELTVEVGHVRRLRLADLGAPACRFNAHALDLTHLFHVLPIVFEGRALPVVEVIGAEIAPPQAAFCMTLSPPLQRAVSQVAREVLLAVGERPNAGRGPECARSTSS